MEHNIIISDVCENAHINTILCKKDDFMRMKDFINNETLENGYGIIISNPIFMWKYNNGEVFYKYIISNLVKTYTDGGILLEPLAEWEDYLEQITLYNYKDKKFYEDNFVAVYKSLRPNDYNHNPEYSEI